MTLSTQTDPAVLTVEEVRLLTALGFVAAGRGDVSRAERIFKGLMAIRPMRAFPYIGLAMAYMNGRRVDEALQVFNEGGQALRALDLANASHNDEYRELLAFRGLILQLAGRNHESQMDLHSAAVGAGPGSALARRMLGLEAPDVGPVIRDQS